MRPNSGYVVLRVPKEVIRDPWGHLNLPCFVLNGDSKKDSEAYDLDDFVFDTIEAAREHANHLNSRFGASHTFEVLYVES